VHGITKQETFLNGAFPQTFFHLRSDIDESSTFGDLEPEFFPIAFHGNITSHCELKVAFSPA
jgi:hypothetical protein